MEGFIYIYIYIYIYVPGTVTVRLVFEIIFIVTTSMVIGVTREYNVFTYINNISVFFGRKKFGIMDFG